MSLAIVYSRAQSGIDAPQVTVEVHLANGLPGLSIVGLPETAVKESKDRVRSALLNSNFEFPLGRITVNLAPADLPKDGGRFDLPIALGILAASDQLPRGPLESHEFGGELALTGGLRPLRGALPFALQTRRAGRHLILPVEKAAEAALVSDVGVFGAAHLLDVCAHLRGIRALETGVPPQHEEAGAALPDLADVRGQHHARRALEIAAAGSHSLLMVGPPGTGKTMLASRLPGILPPMREHEAMESAALASITDIGFNAARWGIRPFRSPHHTASAVALVGGGSQPSPGEISLAHQGVLFLDELPEFDRRVLEVLREPLESGHVTISRAARQAQFPARFQLVAAMNPCPCGYLGHPNGRCRCTMDQVVRYRARISGPLLDRIDMHVEVPSLTRETMQSTVEAEPSSTIRSRVVAARELQERRAGRSNASLEHREVIRDCAIADEDARLLEQAIDRLGLSARAYHRILKVARTIADLGGSKTIRKPHLTEAIGYRRLDRVETGTRQ